MIPLGRNLLNRIIPMTEQSSRTIARIPHYEYHIRFSPKEGRKRPAQDVLDRFKRLGNGMWIRAHPGKNKLRYAKNERFQETSLYYETCTKLIYDLYCFRKPPSFAANTILFAAKEGRIKLCVFEECEMLDKMMTPFWLRRHHYPNDPYAAYHVRHGVNSPRVDDKGNFLRERKKVLLDDMTADKYFCDR